MMVETILESSQDFAMSTNGGALPLWKRELLQRRAARSRATPPAPPPPPAPDDHEELRYGPGIVKRLQSRYLSLALRDAPRRRPSVLRRAASLEHLLDQRPPPAPRASAVASATPAAPALAPAPAPPPRRDAVKRARSVDALSRLAPRDDPPALAPAPAPAPAYAPAPAPASASAPALPPSPPPPPPPAAPRPPVARAARPPRRPQPLLRDAERPPPDVVRAALRKFEPAAPRRAAPAARVSAVLRGLDAAPRSSTPEPRARTPSPAAADLSAIAEPTAPDPPAVELKRVSRAALEGIARAGSTVRYSFDGPRPCSHLPPPATTNPVLLGRVRNSTSPRRVGIIRPMPAPPLERAALTPSSPEELPAAKPTETTSPIDDDRLNEMCPEKKELPLSAIVEPVPRPPLSPIPVNIQDHHEPNTEQETDWPVPVPELIVNIKPPRSPTVPTDRPLIVKIGNVIPRVEITKTEFPIKITEEKITNGIEESNLLNKKIKKDMCPRTEAAPFAGRKLRAAPAPVTSVVFNFSARKEVPDYIENDGLVLRAARARRNMFKAGEAGVVVLRPEALALAGASGGGREVEGEGEEEADGGPPSPCGVRFVNDNVLINGRSSMPACPNRDRIAKLKLQFDDSLTRTFEYPSETSLSESDGGPGPAAAALAANTHIASAALAQYTPSKTVADVFELGVTRHEGARAAAEGSEGGEREGEGASEGHGEGASEGGEDPRPCGADAARSWSESRTHATDLLF